MVLAGKWLISQLLVSTAANIPTLGLNECVAVAFMLAGLKAAVAEQDICAITGAALVV